MEKSGFFNSSNDDRLYDATDFAAYFGKLVTNGIFWMTPNNLLVVPYSGMTATVSPGSAWINGYSYENTEPLELALDIANGIHPRIDRVVLRLNLEERRIFLAVKTGAAVVEPVPPSLTRTKEIYELGIADIAVARGELSVTAAMITDLRLNQSLCGLVNSLVHAVYE